MRGIEKYDNLKEVVPKLMPVLTEAIQSEFLEIKKIDKNCEKFLAACEEHPELKNAEYVIFSQHMKKNEHKYEMFVFIDAEGKMSGHLSGAELELYGLLAACPNLHLSEEYEEQQKLCESEECRH